MAKATIDHPRHTLDTKDVARILDMTPDEITTMARKGVIKALKVGKQWRFSKKAVHYFGKQRPH